jgi:hypothetical protein
MIPTHVNKLYIHVYILVRKDILYMHRRVHYVVVNRYVYINLFQMNKKIEWKTQN